MNELDIRGDTCYGFKDKYVYSYGETLRIPEGVRHIDQNAFKNYGCKFDGIVFPDSLESIGDGAFAYCKFNSGNKYKQIKFGNSLKIIGPHSFQCCVIPGALDIPDTVETIGEYAFSSCLYIDSLTIGRGVKTIEFGAFHMCHIRDLTIKNGVKTIRSEAFSGNHLSNLTIPASVKDIWSRAFAFNMDLKWVSIEGRGVNISSDAFYLCPLSSISEESIKRSKEQPISCSNVNNDSPKKGGLFRNLFR